ncbi:hypothetical protein ACFV8W_15680, partial [Streptomyces sp. NPDC059786]
PTFLLWRRMKLWELRSYDQVIKLEQERLVYQARLRSRFGRAWRRKAPVESLMPLRLARYGVPLAETAPSDLAAAGIDEPPGQLAVEPAPVPVQRRSPELGATASGHGQQGVPASGGRAEPAEPTGTAPPEQEHPHHGADDEDTRHLADAYQQWLNVSGMEPTSTQFALWLQDRYGIATAAGGPLSGEQLAPLLQLFTQPHPTADEAVIEPHAAHAADDGWHDYFYTAWLTYAQEHGVWPDADGLAAYVYDRDQIINGSGRPITGEDLHAYVAGFEQRGFDAPEPLADESVAGPDARTPSGDARQNEDEPEEVVPADAGAHPAEEGRGRGVNASIDAPPGGDGPAAEPAALTIVDRYYLAWTQYQSEHGEQPRAEQLSAYLAGEKHMHGRGGRPVSPSTLRRYLLPFRVYRLWAGQRARSQTPSLDAVARECAAHGITAQHNRPLTTAYIGEQAGDFERRWQALKRHPAQAQQ